MRSALAAHDALVAPWSRPTGGWVFKHTGDGVCAAFPSARGAVEAAVEAQRGWGAGADGMATGAAEARAATYFGRR